MLTIHQGVRNGRDRQLWINRQFPIMGANTRWGLRDNMSFSVILSLRKILGS
jgi:hypothetical protein